VNRSEWISALSGIELGEDAWLEGKARTQRILRLSLEIARRLESQGIQCFRPREEWVTVVGRGGVCEVLPGSQFVHRNIVPIVQQQESRQWCRDLQHFLDRHPMCRMWVVTSGERCWVDEIRERHQEMSRQISKLGHELKKLYDIEFQAARVEFTIREDEGSGWSAFHTFHLHTHLIVLPRKRLTRKQWSSALRLSHKFLGVHFRDCGRIMDAAECSKYLVKIEDTEEGEGKGILSLPAWELAELSRQLLGCQLSRRMGSFAEECKSREKRKVQIKKIPKGENWEWVEVERIQNPGAFQKRNGSGERENIVIGRTVCTFSRPVLEPACLVLNYDGDYEKLLRTRFLGDEDRAFGVISVHTRTRIVRGRLEKMNSPPL